MAAFLRKYGTGSGADVYIPVIKRGVVDFAVSADWTPASGDVKVSIDGGAAASIGTLPTAITMGNAAVWKFVFADAELQGKVIVVTVADSATKAVEDTAFVVETYGHASAKFIADITLANLPANVTQLLGTAWLTPGTAGTPDVNINLVDGSNPAATALKRGLLGVAVGTVGSSSSTTSIITSSLTPAAAVADQFKGRIVTFDRNTTTTNLRGQSTDITGSSSGGVLTVTALTTAPASGDTFTIS